MTSRAEQAAVAAGLAYLSLLAWAMANVSYDIWGALVVAPVYAVVGALALRAMFGRELRPVATVLCWGLLIKLGGAMARYWVGFEAYQGSIDAQSYHDFGRDYAGQVWSGELSVFDAVPGGTGTHFVERFTAFAYTLVGSSQLAGFVTFAFLGYLGLAFIVKATAVAVPGLAVRRFAWMIVLFPSLVYWPSSIGKEALVMFGLGLGTYGIALVLARRSWIRAITYAAAGLGFAGLIRPHMAGIWIAGALPALVLAFVLGSRSKAVAAHRRNRSRLGVIVVVGLAAVALSGVSTITVRFLEPSTDETGPSSLTDILAETQRRSAKSGSTFTPPSISNPVNWPYAVGRTLTRPLPIEARGVAQLASAAELLALAGIYAASWRRLRNLPRMLVTNPYVAFSMTTLFLGGLAFSSFANLGILTRQKSLLFPFLLLLPCLPVWTRRAPSDPLDDERPAEGSAPDGRSDDRASADTTGPLTTPAG